MNIFIAKYELQGIRRSISFNKSKFNKDDAEKWLQNNGIENFWFSFEPSPPKPVGENSMMFSGDVGFEITLDTIKPELDHGKSIILDTYGGDSWEGLKIHDYVKSLGTNPSIGILGNCMSAGMQILLSTENRWMSENSRGLIHNPWSWEAGDDEVFRKAADDLEQEKLQIANIYTKISGKNINDILSLMKKEKIMRADEMLEYNFVKSIGFNNENLVTNNNNNDMDIEAKEKLGGIENILNTIKNKLFSKVKNIVIQDVNGVNLDFGEEVETIEAIKLGDTATANGETPIGEYTMADGTVYLFDAGTLTSISPPDEENETSDIEALTTENETLKAENKVLLNKLEKSNIKLNSQKENIENIKADFEKATLSLSELKNLASEEAPTINTTTNKETGGKKKFSHKKNNK